jgi:DNA invertase Pin-like site-specific DNA recombinase
MGAHTVFFFLAFWCKESQERNQGEDTRPYHGFLHYRSNQATRSHIRIGYARVSIHEQNLDLQKDALKKAGCEKIIVDVVSGKKTQRSGLDQALEVLRKGDRLIVWRLDRLGRSLKHLIELITELEQRGIGFQSLQEAIDTTSSGGKLVFHIFGALAEFERNLIRDRTRAGLEAARARGRKGGRPKRLNTKQRALAVDLYHQRKHTVDEICHTVGISKPTLYAYVGEQAVTTAKSEKHSHER